MRIECYKVSNRFYNPSQDPSKVLATYISAMKKNVSDTMNKPNYEKPVEERAALKSLKHRKYVILQSADKVVIMKRSEYAEKCTADLSNNEFYQIIVRTAEKQEILEINDFGWF